MLAGLGSAARDCVVVATSGHTHLEPARLGDITELARRALAGIAGSVADALAASRRGGRSARPVPHTPRLVLLSCLAPGADQLIAELAVELHFELQVALPSHPGAYRNAMRSSAAAGSSHAAHDAHAVFDRLLRLSAATRDLGLALPSGDHASQRAARHAAYEQATNVMLRHADLLVAVVDLLHRADVGATGEAIRMALRAGRPVVWIDPSRPDRLRWLSHLSDGDFDALLSLPPAARIVPDIVPDSDDAEASADAGAAPDAFVMRTLRRKVSGILAARRAAVRFRAERLPHRRSRAARWAAGLWSSVIEQWLPVRLPGPPDSGETPRGVRRKVAYWWKQQRRGYAVAGSVLGAVWARAVRARPTRADTSATGAAPSAGGERPAITGAADVVKAVAAAVDRERARARELAEYYGGAHRSAILVVALLGVVAVALAAFPAADAVRSLSPASAAHAPAALPTAEPLTGFGPHQWFTLAEFAVILIMFIVYYSHRVYRWQEKAIDFRLLAERFRHAAALLLVGRDCMETAALPVQYSEHALHKSWTEPYFQRAMSRVTGRLGAHLDGAGPDSRFDDSAANTSYVQACREFAAARWLAPQARYQREAAARYEALHLMLEAVQNTLLVFTMLVCVVHLAVHLSALAFFASVLPAMGGALGSLAGQTEVVRLRDRALAMQRALERRLRELSQQGAATTAATLRRFVEATAQDMLGESVEWRVLLTFRPMSSPA